MIISEFKIELNRENVFLSMNCYQDSPIYEELCSLYANYLPDVQKTVKPYAFINTVILPGTPEIPEEVRGQNAIIVLLTLGSEISEMISAFFDRGDYLEGMLLDAMADQFLFQMEDTATRAVRNQCKELSAGVSKRITAPEELPMQIQQFIFNETEASTIGLKIKESYMFDPIKTMTYVLLLSEDHTEFKAEHDCSRCSFVTCSMRKPGV